MNKKIALVCTVLFGCTALHAVNIKSVLESIFKKVDRTLGDVDSILGRVCNIQHTNTAILAKVCDDIPSQLDTIESKIELIAPCSITALTTADISGGAISITTAGNYCLSEDVTADISIAGDCITIDLNSRCMTGVLTINDNSNIVVHNGFVLPPVPTTGSTVAAITITSGASNIQLKELTIECADATGLNVDARDGVDILGDDVRLTQLVIKAGSSANGAGSLRPGGDGIIVGSSANNTVIEHCTISSGDGSDGLFLTNGARGGHGVSVAGIDTKIINNCFTNLGKGGDTAPATTLGTFSGGQGGHGVDVSTGTRTIICNNLFNKMGDGGDAPASFGATVNGGDGGHGISIASGATDVFVQNNKIGNSGAGGTGDSSDGVGGRAIDDAVPVGDEKSIIYGNFAHNIQAAAPGKYRIHASTAGANGGIAISDPPSNAGIENASVNYYVS